MNKQEEQEFDNKFISEKESNRIAIYWSDGKVITPELIKQHIFKLRQKDRDKYISMLKKYKCGKHKKLIKALNNE